MPAPNKEGLLRRSDDGSALPPPDSGDAYAPAVIAERVASAGVAKVALPTLQTFTLGILAGAFIAFGAMLFTLAITGADLGFGPTRLLGGLAFSLGLILVILGGAELFTGNNLIVMAWADGLVSTRALLRNWALVYGGNLLGGIATAVMVHASGVLQSGDMAKTAIAIAEAKAALDPGEAFTRAMLCNTLVCLAVWLCNGARSATGKILCIIFPISAFVALGFEHSIANMYFLPIGWLEGAQIGFEAIAFNLAIVTAGNIVGGSLLVAFVYWIVYRRVG